MCNQKSHRYGLPIMVRDTICIHKIFTACTTSTTVDETKNGVFRQSIDMLRDVFTNFFFFFWGTLFLRKLYLKNLNIQNKNNKKKFFTSFYKFFTLQTVCRHVAQDVYKCVQGFAIAQIFCCSLKKQAMK